MDNSREEVVVSQGQTERTSQTRRRILEAASDCFDRFSIRHTSMDEVAKASKLSRQTIYRHFRDKEQLVDAVSEIKTRAITDLVNERIVSVVDSRSRIVTAILTCVECLVTDRQLREMIEADYKQIMIRAESLDIVAATTARWAPILTVAAADGTLRPNVGLEVMISWLSDIQMLLAMRVIVFGSSLEDMRREVEGFVMDGICR